MGDPGSRSYAFGPFRIDPLTRVLLHRNQPVPLTPKAFDVLLVLVERCGQIVAKDDLMKAVWPETVVDENNLTRGISSVRKALGEKADEHRYVVTVPGRGYSFVARVQELPSAARQPLASGAEIPRATILGGKYGKWLAAGGLLAFVGAAAYVIGLRTTPSRPFERISITRLTNTGNSQSAAISPDGRYLAFVVGDIGQQSIHVRLLAGGGDVTVVPPTTSVYSSLVFSRDGSYIYYEATAAPSGNVLYRVPVVGGVPTRVKEGLESPVTLSPDNNRFAFVREYAAQGESVLIVADSGSGGEHRITSRKLPEYLDYPAWSPDGKTIVCTVVSSSRAEATLVTIELSNRAEKRVTTFPFRYIKRPDWLHDGSGLLLSARDQQSAVFDIWHVSYPRGEVRRITQSLDPLTGVSLTADSMAMVSVQDRLVTGLWVAPREEVERARQITFGASKFSQASWISDDKILSEKQTGDQRHIWSMTTDGRNQKQLTLEGSNFNASVCPDGRSFVYVSEQKGAVDLWRMNIDGSNPTRLVPRSGETFPQCSPDGKWVVYTSVAGGKWETLWTVSMAGGAPVQLNGELADRPAISPDGRWIACFYLDKRVSPQRDLTRASSVAIIPMEGGDPARIFQLPQSVYEPTGIRWARDGKAFTYVDNVNGVSNIWSQPLNAGPPAQITGFRGDRILNFDWSRDGKKLAVSRGTRAYDAVLIRNLR